MYNILRLTIILIVGFYCISCEVSETSENRKVIHENPAGMDENVILPPAWSFGMMYGAYTNQDQSIELINEIIENDYPIDAFWIDSWIWDWKNQGKGPKKYMDFVADTSSYYDMESMWSFMEEKNIKAGMWMWDAIQMTGNEEAYEDFKSKGYFKEEFIHKSSWHNGSRTTIMDDKSNSVKGTWTGNIDFENPEAVRYFKQKVKHFFDMGVDFVKLDKTDNIHVVKAMFELSQELGKETAGRGFVFSHSGGVKTDEYKKYPAKWTDDTRSDWTAKNHLRSFSPWLPAVGFQENIEMYTDTTKHFHKIPFLANDMGGFAISEDGFLDQELYIRWTQMATWLPLTTPFSQPENPSGNIAFNVSEEADNVFREYAQNKMKLFPFYYSYAHQSRWEAKNIVRSIPGKLHEYMLGNEILVAPVVRQGEEFREISFPEGNWVNFWNEEIFEGNQIAKVKLSKEHSPVFVKQGSIIPMRNYARSIELGSNDTLQIHVYLGESGSFTLFEDDGSSNDYLDGVYMKTEFVLQDSKNEKNTLLEIHPALGYYKNSMESRVYQFVFHSKIPVKSVTAGSQSLSLEKTKNDVYTTAFLEANVYEKTKIKVIKD